jgi:hypothetical protein
MRRAWSKQGSIVLDKGINCWNFFYWQDGRRHSKRIGTKTEFPARLSAWLAAKPLRDAMEKRVTIATQPTMVPTVEVLVEQYRSEKMPRRTMTRQGYNTWLTHYILPR